MYFEARPGKPIRLSVSAGAAVFPHDGRTYEDLLAAADNRMYRDKSQRKTGPTSRAAARRQPLPFREEPEPASTTPRIAAGGAV